MIAESDARPSVCVVRLDVEFHFVALSDRLPTNEIFTIVLHRRAISGCLPMSMAIVVQLVR